jgi:GAF domain-containing protein
VSGWVTAAIENWKYAAEQHNVTHLAPHGKRYDLPESSVTRDGRLVRIADTSDKAHWPEFEAQAASHGVRSCLALPLNAGGRSVGALNLYASTASAFGAAEVRRAQNFAEYASGALTLASRMASNAALIEQLRSSLTSRIVIDQALGIIMAREHCTQAPDLRQTLCVGS